MYRNIAFVEHAARLLVFLDDSLAVDQSETMSTGIGAVEDMSPLFLVHTPSVVRDGNLHILILSLDLSLDDHLATGRSKLPGVVGYRIDHEERQGTVGFQNSIRRLHHEPDAFHLEARLSLLHDVEELLQGETLNAEIQHSLLHLNPACQGTVIIFNDIYQFQYILVALFSYLLSFTTLAESGHLVQHTVYIRKI